MTERLQQTADKHGIALISRAAARAVAVVNEDSQIESLVKQSFELLAVCRELRTGLSVKSSYAS